MARAAVTAPARRTLPGRRPARAPLRRAPIAVPRLPTGARLLDTLLSGRAWIALVGVLLVGIVFFNVDLLRVNRQLALTGEKTTAVKRKNARLALELASLSSTERIQRSASQHGMSLPLPGQVRFLRARPGLDARNAAKRLSHHTPAATAPAQDPTPAQQPQTGAPAAAAPAQPQTQAQAPATTTPATPTTPTPTPTQTAPTQQQSVAPPAAGTP
jgi:cell division protein FtsL